MISFLHSSFLLSDKCFYSKHLRLQVLEAIYSWDFCLFLISAVKFGIRHQGLDMAEG